MISLLNLTPTANGPRISCCSLFRGLFFNQAVVSHLVTHGASFTAPTSTY